MFNFLKTSDDDGKNSCKKKKKQRQRKARKLGLGPLAKKITQTLGSSHGSLTEYSYFNDSFYIRWERTGTAYTNYGEAFNTRVRIQYEDETVFKRNAGEVEVFRNEDEWLGEFKQLHTKAEEEKERQKRKKKEKELKKLGIEPGEDCEMKE